MSRSGKHIEEVLVQQGVYVSTTVGVSMCPMLRNRRDTIVVEPLHGRRLRRFEVPLYRRGDDYVLHRCVEVHSDSYTMLGDNCLNKEPDIPDERVIGVLTGLYRGEKKIDMDGLPYRAYVRVWYAIYPLRRCVMRARAFAGRAKRCLKGGKKQARYRAIGSDAASVAGNCGKRESGQRAAVDVSSVCEEPGKDKSQ